MNEPGDPPRLREEPGSGELGELLAAARADLPSARRLDAIASRLGPLLEPPPGGGDGGAPPVLPVPAATSAAALPLKAIAIAGVAIALVVTAVSVQPRNVAPVAPRDDTPVVVEPARPPTHDDRVIATADPLPSSAAPLAKSAPRLVVAAPAVSSAATSPSSEPPAPAASASAEPQETEVAMLGRAQDALGASPARALAITEEHARRFPRGNFGQEREVIAVDALVRLGRTGEARTRAQAFASRFPGSAHVRRLDALVPGVAAASKQNDTPDQKR